MRQYRAFTQSNLNADEISEDCQVSVTASRRATSNRSKARGQRLLISKGRSPQPQREISLLREYRTRLIADVVTGKLDVREAAARLPDEVEEPEPLDEAEARRATRKKQPTIVDAAPEEAEA